MTGLFCPPLSFKGQLGADIVSSAEGAWTDEDQKWAEQLVNKTLAECLWTNLPQRDQLRNGFQSAREGPFRLNKWARVAGESVQYGLRTGGSGFKNVLQELLPEHWILRDKGNCWNRLQEIVLQPILHRIGKISPHQQSSYSTRLRQAITSLLLRWEFLPSVQKNRIWGYEGSGTSRKYMIYKNPHFSSSRA